MKIHKKYSYNVNGDGLSTMDIAVLTNQVPMVHLLQSYGVQERFAGKDDKGQQLNALLREAERCVEDLSSCVLASTSTNGSLSAALLKEKERQLSFWQRRLHLLKRMKYGYDMIRVPDSPTNVQLEVVGRRALKVKFSPPKTCHLAESIVTKYKVEWSFVEDFSNLAGQLEEPTIYKPDITIPDLLEGNLYYVRIAAGNVKGYSQYQLPSPPFAMPSTWRDSAQRSEGRIEQLDKLFLQIVNARPPHAAEIKFVTEMSDTPQQQRRQMRKSIKNLFTSAPKFQKAMKRGVYLACLLYCEDKILVTAEDTLPILEIDETYPSSLHTDFHWLMKVACTWEDVKTLRQDMEKSHSSSSVHFRSKLLQAVEQMQSVLGVQDLGQLFYRPIKDNDGTLVLCTIRQVSDPKSLITLSVKWTPFTKIQRKLSNSSDIMETTTTANEMLVSMLKEMITYQQASAQPLTRGLYLGYVKLKSTVDLIRVLVPQDHPNILPYTRIRENPHISKEEWNWLTSLDSQIIDSPSELQLKFQRAISSAAKNLLAQLEIPESEMDSHRIYNLEVIELNPDVSFVLLLPCVESVCSVPGQCDELTSRSDCIPLPVQIFEMIHMSTYHSNFITLYSRLSSILEMDTLVAQHAHREAFSSTEVATAKTRLTQLQEFQAQVDNTWRGMRWIMDVISFARDKQVSGGILLKYVWCEKCESTTVSPLQSPIRPLPKREPNKAIRNSNSSQTIASDDITTEMRRSSSTSKLSSSTSFRDKMSTSLDLDDIDIYIQPSSVLPHLIVDHALNNSCSGSLQSINDDNTQEKLRKMSIGSDDQGILFSLNEDDQSGTVLRVYASYESGLPIGTSLKLQVTPQTTAKEIVELVVKQLNMAVVLKGHHQPIYNSTQIQNFFLVAISGTNETVLDSDFHPYSLKNPRTKFLVKMKTLNEI